MAVRRQDALHGGNQWQRLVREVRSSMGGFPVNQYSLLFAMNKVAESACHTSEKATKSMNLHALSDVFV